MSIAAAKIRSQSTLSARNFPGLGLFARMTVFMLCMLGSVAIHAQTPSSLDGTVADAKGGMINHATVTLHNLASGKTINVTTDAAGHFSASVPAGSYDVTATAPGFASISQKAVQVQDGHAANVNMSLQIASASSEITVDADETHSVAAAYAPMDAVLSETSARTEITQAFVNNFTSPIADYGEIVGMAPNTFTVSSDGVGLGQSKTYFRGFPDGDYDIDFDGVPFYDTNTPTHHSWAFFPAQAIGGVDFDRSPGDATTIGPAPFGGSIHLLSRELSPLQNVRATFAGGSFNTYLYDLQYDSGPFAPGQKLNLSADVHHMQSHGWQSLNNQNQNAGDIKVQYKISDRTVLTGYSGVVWVDANTPNFSATRCQMYGVPANGSYSCIISGTTLYPSTGAGINFLLTNNSDPLLYLDTQYNYYHVPTDFEYVKVHKEFAHNFVLDIKPYTYNYDNSEKYSNAVPITDNPALAGTTYAPLAAKIVLCNTIVLKKTTYAEPCGVDKYNSYRKYGETSEIVQTSKYGVFSAGMWYEWANTNRHQYPSDPTNNWADQALPNFAEKFVTDSYQPYAQYQWHATDKLNVTAGVKFAYYTIGTKQYADDGKTIGCFTTTVCNPALTSSINPQAFISNGGSYFATLPSASLNYRFKNNWSAYVQAAQGSVVPPSSVFDYSQGSAGTFVPVATLPKQQKNTTYQAGTVVKLKYITFDADYFHIHFDNSYACATVANEGDENACSLQPSSITQGVEGEANVSFTHGIGAYFNASYDRAVYQGSLPATCVSGATGCSSTTPTISVTAPSGLWVAQTPDYIETYGVTYQHGAWDAAFFDKNIGQEYVDNGNLSGYTFHNQALIPSFNFANAFVNYTLRTGGLFDQTKFRFSINNIFNSSAVDGLTFTNNPLTQTIAANGTTYTDPFNTTGLTPINGQDNVSVLSGRCIMLSVTLGFSPKKH